MVKEAWMYPYSSAKHYVLKEEDKLTSSYEPLEYTEDWKEFLSSTIDECQKAGHLNKMSLLHD